MALNHTGTDVSGPIYTEDQPQDGHAHFHFRLKRPKDFVALKTIYFQDRTQNIQFGAEVQFRFWSKSISGEISASRIMGFHVLGFQLPGTRSRWRGGALVSGASGGGFESAFPGLVSVLSRPRRRRFRWLSLRFLRPALVPVVSRWRRFRFYFFALRLALGLIAVAPVLHRLFLVSRLAVGPLFRGGRVYVELFECVIHRPLF